MREKNRLLLLLALILLILLLGACAKKTKDPAPTASADPAPASETPSTETPERTEDTDEPSDTQDTLEGSEAAVQYVQDLSIPEADAAEIIYESGCFNENNYSGLLTEDGWLLGVDGEKNILFLSRHSSDLKRFSRDGAEYVVSQNLLANRQHVIDSAAWDGEDHIVWAESNASDRSGQAGGSDWEIYLMDISTGEITLIDQDSGLRPEADCANSRLSPESLSISDGCVSYLSFARRDDGQVVPSVMLYEIPAGALYILYELQGDPKENIMSSPSIGGGYVAWSQAGIRSEDQLYDGYTLLYELSAEKPRLLKTQENAINPCASAGWLICENYPNNTSSDSNIISYRIAENAWQYKISADYPDYIRSGARSVNLDSPSAWNNYVTWSGDLLTTVVVLDLQGGTRYTIADGAYEISDIKLYPGGLLVWFEHYFDENGATKGRTNYCFLNEEPQKTPPVPSEDPPAETVVDTPPEVVPEPVETPETNHPEPPNDVPARAEEPFPIMDWLNCLPLTAALSLIRNMPQQTILPGYSTMTGSCVWSIRISSIC